MKDVPRDPKHCRYCVNQAEPCRDHMGPHGIFTEYNGPDVYEPTEWVLSVIDKNYNAWDGYKYKCIGYDRRCGFWMQEVNGLRLTNVSELAIGRTYHKE